MSEVASVVVPPKAAADTSEADKAALARADAGTVKPEATGGDKLLAGKYKTQEELEKGYLELVQKLGAPKTDTPADDKPKEGEADLTIKPAASDEDGDAEFQAAEAEFTKDGKLSDDTYAKLAKRGIPKRVVDQYISSMSGAKENYTRQAHDAAGGTEKFTAMQTWAAANADQSTVDAFNSLVSSGDTAKLKQGIALLRSAYEAATGNEPALVDGAQRATGAQGFADLREMSKWQADKRYGKDTRYMREFDAKLAASKW